MSEEIRSVTHPLTSTYRTILTAITPHLPCSPRLSASLLAHLPLHPEAALFSVLCCAQQLSHVGLFAILWTIAHQAPLSMEFSRQEYWRGLPCPPPGHLPNPGMEPRSPTLKVVSLPSEPRPSNQTDCGMWLRNEPRTGRCCLESQTADSGYLESAEAAPHRLTGPSGK